MTGLIVKDLLCLRRNLFHYVLCVVIFGALVVSGVLDLNFFAGFLAMMLSILPFTAFSMDHAAGWDSYGTTFPVKRSGIVAARYLTVLLMTVIGLVLALAGGGVLSLLGQPVDWPNYVLTAVVAMGLGILLNAILLPLLYRFGADRAQVIYFTVLGSILLIGFVVVKPLGLGQWLDAQPDPAPALATAAPLLVVALGAALLALSFLLSRYFYTHREP